MTGAYGFESKRRGPEANGAVEVEGGAGREDFECVRHGVAQEGGEDMTAQIAIVPRIEPEEWKPIPRLPGYIASTHGRIARITGHLAGNNYAHVSLPENVARLLPGHCSVPDPKHQCRAWVHHLIALTFIGEPPKGKEEINHKNRIRNDNRPDNLEWTDRHGNQQHFWDDNISTGKGLHKYKQEDYVKVHQLRAEGLMYREIAAQLNIPVGTVAWIARCSRRGR